MRLVVLHDQGGTIRSIVASPPDAPLMYTPPAIDEQVHQVEVTDLSADMDLLELCRRLDDIRENFRVDVAAGAEKSGNDLPTAELSRKNKPEAS